MKIALFGATGGTGLQVTQQALDAGDEIVALARSPEKLASLANDNLNVVEGDVLDAQVVGQVVAGSDAVIVSLGNTDNNPDQIVSRGTQVIIDQMKQFGVQRLLIVSSLGVADSKDQVPFAFKMLVKTILKKTMADKELQEAAVRDSGLNWTIVRPGGLTDGPTSGGNYRSGLDPKIKAGQVSRADVAEFVLKILHEDLYLNEAPAIT